MTYSPFVVIEGATTAYKKVVGNTTTISTDKDPEFQLWLNLNKDNLPDDIQAKIDDGTLTIADAD